MAETELPKHILRLHALRWKDLIEKYGLTGGHLDWHQSPQRRDAALPPISLLPRPPGSAGSYYGRQGEKVSYEEWVKIRKESRLANRNNPIVVDSIGIAETIAVAKERFAGVVGDYFTIWADETEPYSDEFLQRVERLQNLVVGDVGDLWRKDEWHIAWFDRACRKKINDALGLLAREWALKARKLEIERLESLNRPTVSGHDLGTPNLGSQSYEDAFSEFKNNQQERLTKKQPVPTPSLSGGNLPTWKDLQADFLQHTVEHAGLCAVWTWMYMKADMHAERPPQGQWTFRGGLPASQHLFKEVARRAASRLPDPSCDEPWRLWLDLMRTEGYARKVPRRRVPWQQFKAAAESSENIPLPPEFENQYIENVFKSSADFCRVRSLAESSPAQHVTPDEPAGTPPGGKKKGAKPQHNAY